MRELTGGVASLLAADTLKSGIVSFAGLDVTLDAAEGTKWKVHDVVNFDGANLHHVATVTAVVGDVVTVSNAPVGAFVAPGAADEMRGGYLEWVRSAVSGEKVIYGEPLQRTDPRKVYQSSDVLPPCVCLVGYAGGGDISQHRRREEVDVTIVSRDLAFIEGLLARVRRLMHGKSGDITCPGYDVWKLTVGRERDIKPPKKLQTAGLAEYMLPVSAELSPALV